MRNILFRKKEATVIENMLVSMISLVMVCAFLVIVFGAFSSHRQMEHETGCAGDAFNHGNRRVLKTGG